MTQAFTHPDMIDRGIAETPRSTSEGTRLRAASLQPHRPPSGFAQPVLSRPT